MSAAAARYRRTARRMRARRALRHPSTLPTTIRCVTVVLSALIVTTGAVLAAFLTH